jgi:sugar-specific transcriptional regulator TrmB
MDNIQLLRRLGLTEYEARAYISLAKLGPSTVTEVHLDSKIPRNKVYEALQRLEEKSRVMRLPVTPRKYRLSDPEQFRGDIQDLNKSLGSLIKLVRQPKTTEFREMFWVIRGQKAIQERFGSQGLNAKREILGCHNLSRILYKNIRNLKGAVERGVKVRFICSLYKEKIPAYRAWMTTGADIRVFNYEMFGPLLPRMTVFDGEIASLTIGKPEVKSPEDYLTLWTESRAFAQMLRNHFMNMWRHCKPIEKYL